MEYQEFIEKRKVLQSVINDLKLQYVYTKTNLRIGDTVTFTKKEDSYSGEKATKYTEKIFDFEVYPTTEVIFAKCGNHQRPNIADCKKVRTS